MKPKILLIEDDPSVHAALAAVLGDEGHAVLAARDGREALHMYQQHGDIALAILDLSLAGESGWETFAQLIARDPQLPIIVITGLANQETLAESAGAAAFMEKPLNLPLLLEIVARLASGETPVALVYFSSAGSRGFFVSPRAPGRHAAAGQPSLP